MNISKIMLWSAGLTLALATTTLAAQPRMGGGRGPGQAGTCDRMAGFLNLTEGQKANLKAVADKHQAALEAKQKTANDARAAMRAAMHNPAVTDAQIKELHGKVAAAQEAVMLERRAMMQEFQAFLTPDQKAALAKQQAEAGQGGRGRKMGGGCGGGMGAGCF
jgi:Spy/CpxP family protein refolding chaperone